MRHLKRNPACQALATFIAAFLAVSVTEAVALAASHRDAPLKPLQKEEFTMINKQFCPT
jgi:hypothetical protein